MTLYVALLRGINVGGKNKLPMADLRQIFSDVGARDVRTYIQSGNVLYQGDDVSVAVSEQIAARFGYRVPVLIRPARDWASIVANNPFLPEVEDITKLHVAFLDGLPDSEHVAALDPQRSPPDRFVVRGSEIYLHFPAGSARTKLNTSYFDRALKTTSSIRNWRTTLKLLALAKSGKTS